MIPFSTPFDDSSVDFLESLGVDFYKIASFENTDLPLIRRVAQTGKPMIISTGMASLGELEDMVSTAREAGCRDLVLLKCTSTYPANPENTNSLTIPHMRQMLGCQVGLSDHTLGIGVAVASVALGATVIEKHFTLARAEGGVDSAFSMEPHEMRLLVEESERAWQGLGRVNYGATPAEEKSRAFRRSIYACRDISEGEAFTVDNIRVIRPGFGLAPKYYPTILGKHARKAIKKGDRIGWELIDL